MILYIQLKMTPLKREYYIDFLDKKYPEQLNHNYTKETADRVSQKSSYISPIELVREKNNILNFMFSYKNQFYTLFYDKISEKTYLFNKLKKGKENNNILTQGYLNEGFVTILEPFILDNIRKKS